MRILPIYREQAKGLGIKTNIEQLNSYSARNFDLNVAHAKQSGKNTANMNWAEDISSNQEKHNRKLYDNKE